MGAEDYIKPFPDHVDRARFGDWLSGFVDGEGCFSLGWNKEKDKTRSAIARFAIGLRSDDRDILELIQSFWQCGRITDNKPNISVKNARPSAQYRVAKSQSLASVLIPHFEEHPMWAKKHKDFVIWRRGVELICLVAKKPVRHIHSRAGTLPRWDGDERMEFQFFVDALRQQRQFESTAILIPERDPVLPDTAQSHFNWN